jgi:hypothetical protein
LSEYKLAEESMAYDAASAANYAERKANQTSQGQCAKYVRRAIEWGGIALAHTGSAKNYGPILEAAGFSEATGSPQRGDVVVIQAVPGHPDGHMAIYDGTLWISDFKQQHGLYPGPAYRNTQPSYKIYRYK